MSTAALVPVAPPSPLARRAVELAELVPTVADVEAALPHYLDSRVRRPATRERYRSHVERWVDWCHVEELPRPVARDLVAYAEELAHHHRPGTVQAMLGPVRGVYRWLAEVMGAVDVAAALTAPPRGEAFGSAALTTDQVHALLDHLDSRARSAELVALRDRAVVGLMARCGLRDVEVVRADVGDLTEEGGRRVLFVHGKAREGKDELVVLTARALAPITAYLKARGRVPATAPLFASHGPRNAGGRLTTRAVSRVVKGALLAAGVTHAGDPLARRYTAHSLRHSFVTHALRGGASPEAVQAAARHRSLATTTRYVHHLDRLEHPAEDAIPW